MSTITGPTTSASDLTSGTLADARLSAAAQAAISREWVFKWDGRDAWVSTTNSETAFLATTVLAGWSKQSAGNAAALVMQTGDNPTAVWTVAVADCTSIYVEFAMGNEADVSNARPLLCEYSLDNGITWVTIASVATWSASNAHTLTGTVAFTDAITGRVKIRHTMTAGNTWANTIYMYYAEIRPTARTATILASTALPESFGVYWTPGKGNAALAAASDNQNFVVATWGNTVVEHNASPGVLTYTLSVHEATQIRLAANWFNYSTGTTYDISYDYSVDGGATWSNMATGVLGPSQSTIVISGTFTPPSTPYSSKVKFRITIENGYGGWATGPSYIRFDIDAVAYSFV